MTAEPRRPAFPGEREWPWLVAGVLLVLGFGYTEMMGSDLWWHLAGGREIVQTGTIWLRDDWSFSEAGSRWHNHEWLADLLFYAWVQLFGVPSLVVWKWLILLVTFGLLQRVLGRVSGSPPAALLGAVFAAAVAAPFLDLRPQLYTLLAVAVLLNIALRRHPRPWELALLFLLWVNLHGGFLFGLMLLGILLLPWREPSVAGAVRAVGTVLACMLVTLLNPDGWQAYAYPLEYALNADSPYRNLAEWKPPFQPGGIRSPLYPWALGIGAALAAAWLLPPVRRWVSLQPEALAFAALTAAMSLTSRRFVILYALAVALLLAPFAAAFLRRRLGRRLALPLLLLALGVGVYRQWSLPLRPQIAFHYLTAEYAFPHALADFVAANALRGNTFAYYNWGGYLHWRGDGALKVFIDGRANTLYDDRDYRDYVRVLAGRPGWIEAMEASGADLFLWTRSRGGERLIRELYQTGRWRILYQDGLGALLARREFPLPAALRVPRDTLYSDLAFSWESMRAGRYDEALRLAERARARQPWNRAACVQHARALGLNGRRDEGLAVRDACRGWFPSRFL
jgi:hypothetical protein